MRGFKQHAGFKKPWDDYNILNEVFSLPAVGCVPSMADGMQSRKTSVTVAVKVTYSDGESVLKARPHDDIFNELTVPKGTTYEAFDAMVCEQFRPGETYTMKPTKSPTKIKITPQELRVCNGPDEVQEGDHQLELYPAPLVGCGCMIA